MQALNSKRTAVRQAIRRFMVGEDGISGAALVEFSIFGPLLVVVSIYTMDFSLLFYNKMEFQNAAQAGAQWAIANRIYNSSAIQVAAQGATTISSDQITVSSNEFCGCPSTTGVTLQNVTIPTGSCSGVATCGTGGPLAGNYVTVTARTPKDTPYRSFIPYGLISSNYNIIAQSTVRIQ